MSREIKFRYACKDMAGQLFFIEKNMTDFLNAGMNNHGRIQKIVSVDQWTGLTDRNGKEIYENDIVKRDINKPHDYSGHGIYKMQYRAPSFGIMPISFSDSLKSFFGEGKIFGNDFTSLWNSDLKNIEIIGNVHENPELLK